jgi:hypothetical protein
MPTEQIAWIFAWIFFLICGGIMMLGVYFIFGRENSDQRGQVRSREQTAGNNPAKLT